MLSSSLGKPSSNKVIFAPQKGKQEDFLRCSADICLYGGGAGGGKTYGLMLGALRHVGVAGFTGAIFRRNYKQIFDPGGMWSTACEIFPNFGAKVSITRGTWDFYKGKEQRGKISFHSMKDEKDKLNYQGSQLCPHIHTRVVMGDGSLKFVKDLAVGDMVKTLMGAKRVTHVSKPKLSPCIALMHGSLLLQINTFDHRILATEELETRETTNSFLDGEFQSHPLSAEALTWRFLKVEPSCHTLETCRLPKCDTCTLPHPCPTNRPVQTACTTYGSRPPYASCSSKPPSYDIYEQCSSRLFQESCSPSLRKLSHHWQASKPCHKDLGLQGSQATSSDEALTLQEKASSESLRSSLTLEMLASGQSRKLFCVSCLLRHFQPFQEAQVDNAASYAQTEKAEQDLMDHCSLCFYQYDEHDQNFEEKNLLDAQQPVYAVERIRYCCMLDVRGSAPKHTHPSILFEHPYADLTIRSEGVFYNFPFSVYPCGLMETVSFTVSDASHYISSEGLISSNCGLYFDELTHFTESQWSYMFSRNRSTCGVRPYIRATCNPQDEGFVRRLVDWWIGEDGFPIEERSGVIRYMIRDGDDIHFFDRRDDIPFRHKGDARTFTFIPSKVFDNQILMNKDPAYLSNLKALPLYDRAQLLEGNWNIKREAGMYFRSHWFEVIDRLPVDPSLVSTCRYWDRAATTPTDGTDPDYTAGVKVGRYGDEYFVMDVVRLRETPLKVQDAIKRTSSQDSRRCLVGLEQEGGASGIAECEYLKKALELYNVEIVRAEKSKEWRAKPVSAASEQGRVKILRAPWNKAFLSELQGFPLGSHDDQVDALAGAFNILNRAADYSVFKKILSQR